MKTKLTLFFCVMALLLMLNVLKAQPCVGTATFNVAIENCSATMELADRSPAVFPNPAQTMIWVRNPGDAISLQLFNAMGIVVLEKAFSKDITAEIQVNNLPDGIYFVRLNGGMKIWSRPLCISKNP